MFYATLVTFVLVFFTPPFQLARHAHTWASGHHVDTGLPLVPALSGSPLVFILLLGVYLVVAVASAATVRFLWPAHKPLPLRLLCMPDELGGLNLLILVLGASLFVFAVRTRAEVDVVALGLVTSVAMVGHFWEMTEWQYEAADAKRRRWARGL